MMWEDMVREDDWNREGCRKGGCNERGCRKGGCVRLLRMERGKRRV